MVDLPVSKRDQSLSSDDELLLDEDELLEDEELLVEDEDEDEEDEELLLLDDELVLDEELELDDDEEVLEEDELLLEVELLLDDELVVDDELPADDPPPVPPPSGEVGELLLLQAGRATIAAAAAIARLYPRIFLSSFMDGLQWVSEGWSFSWVGFPVCAHVGLGCGTMIFATHASNGWMTARLQPVVRGRRGFLRDPDRTGCGPFAVV